jgi:four helix bundle protein
MEVKRNSFRDLNAYKEGKVLVKMTYLLLEKFPSEEKYALCEQIRRAVISVTSNIAEGTGRISIKEQMHFLEISYGSLMEVLSQMDIALDLGYIDDDDFRRFEFHSNNCASLISGLRSYLERSLNTNL